MRAVRPLKLLFLFILVGGVSAIGYSFYSRRQGREAAASSHDLLPPGIESRSTGFEHFEKDQGRNVFHVAAASSTVRDDGRRLLEGVRLVLFDAEGAPADVIEGRKALYRDGERKVDFEEDVAVRLADGTRITSTRLRADLESQVVNIDRNFNLEQRRARGTGRSLLYRVDRRIVRMTDLSLDFPSPGAPIRVEATRAIYDLSHFEVSLHDGARVRRGESLLQAVRIEVFLDQGQRLRRLDALQQAHFRPAVGQEFAGGRILMEFAGSEQRLMSMDVLSSPTERAKYSRQEVGGNHELEADRIAVDPAQAGDAWTLRRLRASGEVAFRSEPLSVPRGSSRLFVMTFDEAGSEPERLFLEGDVSLERHLSGEIRTLTAGSLTVDLASGSVVQRARAADNARIVSESSDQRRSIHARDSLDFDFQEGLLKTLKASGDCLLETRGPQERNSILAPTMDFFFQEGRPHLVKAGDSVRADLNGIKSVSRRMELTYRQGLLVSAHQEGDFRLSLSQAGVDLQTDEADYDPSRDVLRAGGRRGPYLLLRQVDAETSPTRTLAGRYRLIRSQGRLSRLEAEGGVTTRMADKEGERVVTAREMSVLVDTDLVEYRGDPVLQSPRVRIAAQVIRLLAGSGDLEAQGGVRSRFKEVSPAADSSGASDPSGLKTFEVASERVLYQTRTGAVQFRQDVQLVSSDLTWNADEMDLIVGEQEDVDRIDSRGHVVIRLADGRKAEGEKAVYTPADDQVEMSGNPVRLTDAEGGQVTGSRLTFRVADDSLRVEKGPADKP